MSDLNNYFLALDTSKAHDDLDEVEAKRKDTEAKTKKALEEMELARKREVFKTINSLQLVWNMIETTGKLTGQTVPLMLGTVIDSAFSAIDILTPLFLAQGATMNPFLIAKAVFGITQLSLTTAAVISGRRDLQQLSSSLRDTENLVTTINTFVGSLNY